MDWYLSTPWGLAHQKMSQETHFLHCKQVLVLARAMFREKITRAPDFLKRDLKKRNSEITRELHFLMADEKAFDTLKNFGISVVSGCKTDLFH